MKGQLKKLKSRRVEGFKTLPLGEPLHRSRRVGKLPPRPGVLLA
jgi:hypothetical protein